MLEQLINKVTFIRWEEGIKSIPDSTIDMVLTDIPYTMFPRGTTTGCGYNEAFNHIGDGQDMFGYGLPDKELMLKELYRVMKPQAHCYIFASIHDFTDLLNAVKNQGFKLANLIVWKKNKRIANRYYMNNCEFIWMIRREKDRSKYVNDCSINNVLECPILEGKKRLNPTEKPLEILETMIKQSSQEGEIVLDLFAGSASTGVASIRNNRRFIGFEIDEIQHGKGQERLEALLQTLKGDVNE